jgi:hypothetical protein
VARNLKGSLWECLPALGSGEKFKLAKGEAGVDHRPQDGVMKLFYMLKTILKQWPITRTMSFYKFSGAPMPYDIIIKAKNAGTIDVEYTAMASSKAEALTVAELEEMKGLKPLSRSCQSWQIKLAAKSSL